MQGRLRGLVLGVAAAGGGVGLAIAMGGGSAGAAGGTTTTLGSTTGSPSMNICSGGINCTYVPFDPVSTPELQVPFDGTVTSFSVNAGSAGGTVHLRVLRPAGNGQFTGAGTSPAETLAAGPNTFTLSPGLPVKAGDVLGLDNDSSALMFDTTSQTAVAGYYELPALADGSTAAPNHRADYRLLLSAVVASSGTTTTGTTSTTTTTSTNGTTTVMITTTITTPTGRPPTLAKVSQSHRTWRLGSKLAKASANQKPPVGTTFSLRLDQTARVSLTFYSTLGKRKLLWGTYSFAGHVGLNKVAFQGRINRATKLAPGHYSVVISAVNPAFQTSKTATLHFTVTA